MHQWEVKVRPFRYAWEEEEEMGRLTTRLQTVQLNDEDDCWRWKEGKGGELKFSVASFYESLTVTLGIGNFPSRFVWKVDIPLQRPDSLFGA
ncbi:hypothetical protein FRX31_030457 [Thalictrum thalictroides]|uniref:Uncharacterized protein n=1 Tax=Thalictrum thalictroides TaxID=46969 RepID=A0A7J6V4G3_THATH|nr:hypothetical protein FRX31_030457 [Thalictrum thalictroides]